MRLIKKIIHSIWERLISQTQGKAIHKYVFPAYWHSIFHFSTKGDDNHINFFTACPNRGAGIGHQIANWHSGYWWSQFYGLHFAHLPFAQKSWEDFLGYGIGEKSVSELKQNGYKIIRIPQFDEYNEKEIQLTKDIINSYKTKQVVFYADKDQPYHDQIDIIPIIRQKFYSTPVRESDLTPYLSNNYNIAIHVRRGDITIGQANGDPNLTMRWLDNQYFEKVLDQAMSCIRTQKDIHIYIFSQGEKKNFMSFSKYPNVHYFLNLNPESTFLSFVYADMLITSKSSFSYKPALLNIKGIKICPQNFWHSYPKDKNWILAKDDGTIPPEELRKFNQE